MAARRRCVPRLDADAVHALAASVRGGIAPRSGAVFPGRDRRRDRARQPCGPDPEYPERRLAERLIPAVTGYDASMVRIELKRYMRMFRRRELLRFVDDELNCPQMLDEYRPNRSGGYTRLYGQDCRSTCFPHVPGHSRVEHDDGSADEARFSANRRSTSR